jgi:hypothetical protein
MLTVSKGGRKIRAMVLNEPVDRCLGVVQCALEGCQAYLPLRVDEDSAKEQVAWFLEHHECRATGKKPTRRRPA